MDDKHCKVCGVLKPLDAFYRTPGTKDGRRGDCIDCNLAEKARRNAADPRPARDRVRRWRDDPENFERVRGHRQRYRADGRKALSDRASYLKRKYGITVEEYDEMLVRQQGVCAICLRDPNPKIALHVDHDHDSGAIRGLTCFRCNQAMGAFSEDPMLLRAAAAYLERHSSASHMDRDAIVARLRQLPTPVWKRPA